MFDKQRINFLSFAQIFFLTPYSNISYTGLQIKCISILWHTKRIGNIFVATQGNSLETSLVYITYYPCQPISGEKSIHAYHAILHRIVITTSFPSIVWYLLILWWTNTFIVFSVIILHLWHSSYIWFVKKVCMRVCIKTFSSSSRIEDYITSIT